MLFAFKGLSCPALLATTPVVASEYDRRVTITSASEPHIVSTTEELHLALQFGRAVIVNVAEDITLPSPIIIPSGNTLTIMTDTPGGVTITTDENFRHFVVYGRLIVGFESCEGVTLSSGNADALGGGIQVNDGGY